MTQAQEWSNRLISLIAGQIKRYRQHRGLSAQQLADACEHLGHPVPRSVIANLESGRRAAINLPEILVLAEALNVPPILLVFPLGQADAVEMLPGIESGTWEALCWFTGERSPSEDIDAPGASDPRRVLDLYRNYDRQLWDLDDATTSAWLYESQASNATDENVRKANHAAAEASQKRADEALKQMQSLLRTLRLAGLKPPTDTPLTTGDKS